MHPFVLNIGKAMPTTAGNKAKSRTMNENTYRCGCICAERLLGISSKRKEREDNRLGFDYTLFRK